MLPWLPDGVPTQISDRSACSTASDADVVARRRPLCAPGGDELHDPRLDDRALAGVDRRDLGVVDVDADDRVSSVGKPRCGDRADVPQAEYGDLH